MGLDDLPTLSGTPVNLGAVPAVLVLITPIGNIIECQYSSVTHHLNQGVEYFIVLDGYLSADQFIILT
jgi:hypothetical protein